MNKKGIIVAIAGVIIAIGIVGSFSSYQSNLESVNLDMERTHGSVSTAMGSPILGNPNAPITIVEFGDYQCPNCKAWFLNTKPEIVSNYIDTGKANLVYVDLAFLGRDSSKAAQATYCAEDQGKYWEYHDILYRSQEGIDTGWANSERLQAFAFSLDLDVEMFDVCMSSEKFLKRVNYNLSQAQKSSASATPTFIIVGPDGQQQKLVGAQPYSSFQNVLDSMI